MGREVPAVWKRCTNTACYMKSPVETKLTKCIACNSNLKTDGEVLADAVTGSSNVDDLLDQLFGRRRK